jgi:hypothetical protein
VYGKNTSECLTVQCVLVVHFLILFCRNVSQYSVFLSYTFSFRSVGLSHSTVCLQIQGGTTFRNKKVYGKNTLYCETFRQNRMRKCTVRTRRNVSQYSVFLSYTFSFCSVGMSHSTVCSCRTLSHSVLSECLTVQCVLVVHFLIPFCWIVSHMTKTNLQRKNISMLVK